MSISSWRTLVISLEISYSRDGLFVVLSSCLLDKLKYVQYLLDSSDPVPIANLTVALFVVMLSLSHTISQTGVFFSALSLGRFSAVEAFNME
jgi:hypothetical protein